MKPAKDFTAKFIEGRLQEVHKWYETEKGSRSKKRFERIHRVILKRKALNLHELYDAAHWKSPRASKRVRTQNPDRVVRLITKFALKMSDERFKIRLLSTLDGIGVPRASAILAMSDPKKYGVIDTNAWYALTGKYRSSFDDDDWMWYLCQIRRLARKFRKTAREIELALWEYGKSLKRKRKRYSRHS
jgi:hypothetical protein